ncbi:MAG: kelch repeat-containing protein [Gemmatimonadota bacterium]
MSRVRRWLLAGAVLAAVLAAGGALGFVTGRRWPITRLEHLKVRLFGESYGEWRVAAKSDLNRYEVMKVVRGDSMYLFSGFFTDEQKATARVEMLDLASGNWIRKHDMPQALTHTAPVVIRDTAWFVAGFEGDHPGPATTRVWRYSLANDEWSAGPAVPEARGGGGLVAVGDTLHYFGGWLADRNTDAAEHWTLVIGDSAWRAAAPMPMPRGHLTAAVAAGQIFVIGGVLGHDPVPIDVAEVHRFDLATGTWASRASLPFPLSHVEPATESYGEWIITAGGRSREDGRENVDDVLGYNTATDRWVHLARTPKPFLGGVTAIVGDTLYAGLGAIRGSDPDNPLIWRTTLRNQWRQLDSLPTPLGEVAGGVINGKLYLVGEGNPGTAVYDIAAGRWEPAGSVRNRPASGNHHAAEVVGGKLYLLGGFGRNAEGLLQVFDPVIDRWSLGPAMPFATGAAASALIDGKIYVAGGIVGNTTTEQAAVFDVATQQWTALAPMPRPRNHAASGTDGKRFYVFGGRGPGSGDSNVVANGFDDVQIFDPETGKWAVSDGTPGAPLPLPQARGGTGKAVWLNGEFWVIGGETATGAGAARGGTYNRVDLYDPVQNRWRRGEPLPTPRHGVFPVTDARMVWVAGGGTTAGGSESTRLEMIWPRRATVP